MANPKRVCVVGAGRWGRNHVRTLHELGCLGGIVEPDAAASELMRSRYPEAAHFPNVKDAVAAGFDGYTVATPAETHAEVGRYLLEQGCHVLVEKPLALRASEARALQQLAAQRGVNLMVGHLLLFHPAIRQMKQQIAAGKIGKLQYLYSNRLNLGMVRKEENILWSFAPHDVSIFQHLIGARPVEVVSRGGAFVQPHIHDSTMTVLTYPDNIVGHIFVSWLHPFKEHRLVVIGSKGMLTYEDTADEPQLRYYEKGIDWVQGEPMARTGPTEVIPFDAQMPLTAELRAFVECLDGRPVSLADAASAVEVLEILERATASLLEGDDETMRRGAIAEAVGRIGSELSPGVYVHPTSYVDADVEIGEGTKVWHYSHVQSGARIGRDCSLGQNVNVGNNVRIGNAVKIQNNVSVYEGVDLEDHVFCGPSMVFTNIKDPRCKYPQRGSDHYLKTLVREGATLGANCTIVCGVTIGRHAMIGAGALVTKDVVDYSLVVGAPARHAGWVCECGERLGAALDAMECIRCGCGYRVDGGGLVPKPKRQNAKTPKGNVQKSKSRNV